MTWDVALLGLVTGIAFGFAIFKFGACGYQRILDMLLLKDFSTLKFMMAAVMVGAVGVYLLDNVIWIASLQIVRVLVGGLIFGVGFALLGACPGTVMIGLGRGQKDSFFGVIGGLVGAGLFAQFYLPIKDTLYHIMDYGKVTMGSAFGLSEGAGVIILLVMFGGTIVVINKLTAPKEKQIEAENYSIK